MAETPHRKLAKCHVLFLGDSTPEQTNRGLKALQQPLMKCYPVDKPNEVEGIDSWITILTSGILLQFVGNKSDRPAPIWFPIQNLFVAAATKCINYIDPNTGQRMETEFVDINNEAAEQSSHPPLFSLIVRRTSGKRILRCYTFLMRDEAPAVAMVDAAKYAFTHESGWSNKPPPAQVIQNELVPVPDDADDIDEFDSVSTAGRKANKNSPGNQSQNISDADEQSANESRASRTFPSQLVKKYILTNTNRGLGGSPPTRRPIPAQFMYHPANESVRSAYHGVRSGPPLSPYMMNGSRRGGLPDPASLAGSMRSTSTVRVVNDPYTRTSVIERVIRQPVPVPIPVYQPPPPPQIIQQPIYIPQPPEIRHVPVEREVRVPVEVPVHYPVGPDPRFRNDHQRSPSRSKHSHRHKSHKQHNAFKNYEIFDDRFVPKEDHRPSFFVNPAQPYNLSAPPTNGFFVRPPGEHYHATPRRKKSSERRRRHHSRSSSSGGSSSDGEDRRLYRAGPGGPSTPYRHRNRVEITELSSPDERSHSKDHRKSHKAGKRPDIDGNHNHNGNYYIRQLEKDTANYHITEVNKGREVADDSKPDFQWTPVSAAQPLKEQKSEKRNKKDERRSREVEESPDYATGRGKESPDYATDRGKVYIGADVIEELKQNGNRDRSSFHAYRQNGHQSRNDERQDKKKDKKKRDKTPSKYEAKADARASTSKEYYFKEHTEKAPRNWMDQQKEYMNERAFSSSLANDPDEEMTNAYALNRGPDDDDMFDRSMPAPPPLGNGGIPVPPPIPAELQIGGRIAADLY